MWRQPFEVTDLPVSGSDQEPSSLGAPTVELDIAPTAAPSAIPVEETGPTVYKGDTGPISSKSPVAQVGVMPIFHPSAVSTTAPNGEDTKPPFPVHSAAPTSRVLTIQASEEPTSGGVAISTILPSRPPAKETYPTVCGIPVATSLPGTAVSRLVVRPNITNF